MIRTPSRKLFGSSASEQSAKPILPRTSGERWAQNETVVSSLGASSAWGVNAATSGVGVRNVNRTFKTDRPALNRFGGSGVIDLVSSSDESGSESEQRLSGRSEYSGVSGLDVSEGNEFDKAVPKVNDIKKPTPVVGLQYSSDSDVEEVVPLWVRLNARRKYTGVHKSANHGMSPQLSNPALIIRS
jgi:hypothetical protein